MCSLQVGERSKGQVKVTENRWKEIELPGQNEETGTGDSETYRSKSVWENETLAKRIAKLKDGKTS